MKKLPTRKKIIAALKELVSASKCHSVSIVGVYSQTNHSDPNGIVLVKIFGCSNVKDDLLAFLMDKSLTHRILNVRWWCCKTVDSHRATEVYIYLLGSDEKFLEYTNIDSEMLELLGKVRFLDEDI